MTTGQSQREILADDEQRYRDEGNGKHPPQRRPRQPAGQLPAQDSAPHPQQCDQPQHFEIESYALMT